jgi:hypothetical protein
VKNDIANSGPSAEEDYFYKLNQELIEKRRKELDAERAEREAHEKRAAFWMICPKCGATLEEVDLAHIKVDKCPGCQGIFFDHGELDTLLESREPKGFLDTLRKVFS